MDKCIVTIALATRLKRCVFSNRTIRGAAEELIRQGIGELNVKILDLGFEDYGLIITVENQDEIPTDDIAYFIRKETSGPLRKRFAELSRMPSLWMRDYYCKDGILTDSVKAEIQAFYSCIKTR